MRLLKPEFPPLVWGIAGVAVSLTLYSGIIVITTPNLKPLDALRVAFLFNPLITLGVPFGMGIQSFFSAYLKRLPCPSRAAKPAFGATASGSALSSFFSFFSLTQVGCCSVWLFYLSLLPSVVGVGAAGFFIRYSRLLSDLSLVLVALPIVYLLMKIRRVKRLIQPASQHSPTSENVIAQAP